MFDMSTPYRICKTAQKIGMSFKASLLIGYMELNLKWQIILQLLT